MLTGDLGKALLIKDNLEGFNGHAACYELKPALWTPGRHGDNCQYVVASAIHLIFGGGVETMIFPSDELGNVIDWDELACVRKLSHRDALNELGYQIHWEANK